MVTMNWASRSNKARARVVQMRPLPSGQPIERGLFLPGWDHEANDGALCVQEALRSGLIGPNTELVIAERDSSLMPFITAKLDELGLAGRYMTHADWLDGRPGSHKLEFYEDQRFDFGFFDLMGCIDHHTAQWIAEHFVPQLVPGASLSFTVRYNLRRDDLARGCAREVMNRKSPYFPHAKQIGDAYGIEPKQKNIVIHLLVLNAILRGWVFDAQPPYLYKDNRAPMIAFRFDDLRPYEGGEDPRPTIYDLLDIERPAAPVRALRRARTVVTSPEETKVKIKTLRAGLSGTSLTELLAALPNSHRASVKQLAEALVTKLDTAVLPLGERIWATRRANAAATGSAVAPTVAKSTKTPWPSRAKASDLSPAHRAWITRRANLAAKAAGQTTPATPTAIEALSPAKRAWVTRRANLAKAAKAAKAAAKTGTALVSTQAPPIVLSETKGKRVRRSRTALTAAQKSWQTRRQKAKNALIQAGAPLPKPTASAVALVAAKAPSPRRSAGAVKAWKTRRANGWVHPRARAVRG